MDNVKIEQVVVGGEVGTAPVEMKTEPVVTPISHQQQESLQCFQCLITFCSTKAKERHIKKNHMEQYKQLLMENNTLFTCYTCERDFTSSEELSEHQVIHITEEKPFHCTFCYKPFLYFSDMNKHRRRYCKGRRCLCTDCGILFPSNIQLRSHRIAAHPQGSVMANSVDEDLLLQQEKFADQINSNAKPAAKKRGRKPKNLVTKQGAREGKKMKNTDSPAEGCSSTQLMIPCPEDDCELIFNSVAALRAHKKEAHKSEAQKPPPRKAPTPEYSCFLCGQSFTRESSLKAHHITHIKKEEEEEEVR